VVTASSPGATEAIRARRISGPRRLIRQASAWLPAQAPRPARLQELEDSEAIRWVDVYGGVLRDSEALALLDPVCEGELTPRMVRDLITPARYPAGRSYDGGRIAITAAFRTRHVARENGAVTSVFEPVHLLAGEDWLLSCWLPPRVYRGLEDAVADGDGDEAAEDLYQAVAGVWPESGGETAADLAEVAHRALAAASGEHPFAG
jgi:hypothetical protein